LVTVTDGGIPPSSFIHHHLLLPFIAHRSSLRTVSVPSQHIVRRSRSVTIVRHHHPFIIIIIAPRAQHRLVTVQAGSG
jgi:hypothetical protein